MRLLRDTNLKNTGAWVHENLDSADIVGQAKAPSHQALLRHLRRRTTSATLIDTFDAEHVAWYGLGFLAAELNQLMHILPTNVESTVLTIHYFHFYTTRDIGLMAMSL